MNPTSIVVVVTDAIAAALPALYVVLSAVDGIVLLLVLKRRIAAARRRRALAPLRDLKATLIGRKGEAGVGVALARLRLPTLHDVVLEDDLGVTQIDHLVRARDEIVVIETKIYVGVITGGLDDREWMQRLDSGECNRLRGQGHPLVSILTEAAEWRASRRRRSALTSASSNCRTGGA